MKQSPEHGLSHKLVNMTEWDELNKQMFHFLTVYVICRELLKDLSREVDLRRLYTRKTAACVCSTCRIVTGVFEISLHDVTGGSCAAAGCAQYKRHVHNPASQNGSNGSSEASCRLAVGRWVSSVLHGSSLSLGACFYSCFVHLPSSGQKSELKTLLYLDFMAFLLAS